MKNISKKLFMITVMAVLCMVGATTANATTYKGECGLHGDNLVWTFDKETESLIIDGEGQMKNYDSPDYAPWHEFSYEIKNLIIDADITSIGNYAFYNCSELKGELVIPMKVTSIGVSAFSGCDGLTGDLVIPDSVKKIGEKAFSGCSGFNGKLVVSDNVTSIGEAAFALCNGLKGDLVIPEGIKSIGSAVFQGCSGFTGDLIIPDSVTSIGDYAFFDCKGLTGELTIPESVGYIGVAAFSGCSGFTGGLVIPEGVTNIGASAFSGCRGLTGNLIIPASVTSISNWTFSGCKGFTGDLVIPEGVTSIGENAFSYCDGFTGKLVIPDSVTSIGMYAFSYCEGFTGDLVIPKGLTSISYRAFEECSGFTGKLVIPEGVISIDGGAFIGCVGLTGSLIIPESVTSIGDWAFAGCEGFAGDVILPEGFISMGDCAFFFCDGLTGELIIPESVENIGSAAFVSCSFKHIAYKGSQNAWFEIYDGESTDSDNKTVHFNFNPETDIKENTTSSTCLIQGTKTLDCICGYNYSIVELYPLAECLFTEYVYDDNATCLDDGTKTRHCSYGCGNIDTVTVENSALGHDIVFHSEKAPTCMEKGWYAYEECTRCNYSTYKENPIIYHIFTEWTTENKKSIRYCVFCKYTQTKIDIGSGDVEIDSPYQIDKDFVVDSIVTGDNKYVIIEGAIENGVENDWEVVKAFDINLLNKEGVHVQPDGMVKVKLPVDWSKEGEYKVYRVNEDRTLTDMSAFREGSHMVFDTDHFSVYTIVLEIENDNCPCKCHKTGFSAFIWKILRFFYKLFKTNTVCACGMAHY